MHGVDGLLKAYITRHQVSWASSTILCRALKKRRNLGQRCRKPMFYEKKCWVNYLTYLSKHRFNNNLAFEERKHQPLFIYARINIASTFLGGLQHLENYKLRSQTKGFWGPGSLIWVLAHLGQWLRGRCNLIYFYFKLCRPFCPAEQNCFCNFGSGQYEEYFCENMLNLGQWLKRKCQLNIFLFSSGIHFVLQSGKVLQFR